MRRPKVHRVEFVSRNPGPPRLPHFDGIYDCFKTRCGIYGGSELLKLQGANNGSGHYCSECWPGATPIRRQRPVPDGRWW